MPGPLDVTSPDWPAQAADRVVETVDSIRAKTTVPLQTAARAIVYGFVAAVMATAAIVLLAIGAVRFIDVWIPGDVWRAHLVVGMLFTLVGLFLWSKRRRKD